MRILLLTLLFQIVPNSPSNLQINFNNTCTDPIPNPNNLFLSYLAINDSAGALLWYEAVPQHLEETNPTYCHLAGWDVGIGLCPVRDNCPGYKCLELIPCKQVIIGGLAPSFSLGSTPDGTPSIGTVVVNPDNPWQAKCINCNVGLKICNGPGTVCIDP